MNARFAVARLLAGAVIAAGLGAGAPAIAETALVEGFRSARFDMTEDQVKQAIAADFKIQPAAVLKQVNKVDRTTILSVRVPDLLPESGTAQVNYKLGFKNKKLIQVDVIWGPAVDQKVAPAALTAVLINLRQYLQERGFAKEKTVVNATTPQPNILLMFRAEDEKGRVVALLGQFKFDPKAEKDKQLKTDEPQAVILSYVLDPKAPDIYRIEKGKF
ncbi:MAG: hypothetical protein JNM29_09530 [Candidatus Odyssella sp.]|nr:hypothetical protein [Candidatus Odyssella sp.]